MIDISSVIRKNEQVIYMILNDYVAFMISQHVKKRMIHIVFSSAMIMY